jgi:hypothetical protein
VWLAVDDRDDTIVGAVSAFARQVYVNGAKTLAWVLGDFCINERYRSLGPALTLQRACLADVDTGDVAFCYDFPSRGMMAVYARLHIDACCRMVRLAKPLRLDRKIYQLVENPALARGLSTLGNLLVNLNVGGTSSVDGVTISLHENQCGDEFSIFADEIAGDYAICTRRSAEYLNWRYLGNPLHRHELLTARRNNTLLAYAVFTVTGEDATLVDLFGIDNASVISSLISSLCCMLKGRGVATVNAPLSETHVFIPVLKKLGFRLRESCPIVAYPNAALFSRNRKFGTANWFLTYGDRDS